MNTTLNQNTAISSAPKRIILATAHRHEQHSTGRQERATKTLRRMRGFEDNEVSDHRRLRLFSSADELLDD
jgi:hypothetical protein